MSAGVDSQHGDTLMLPEFLDLRSAAALKDSITARRGGPLSLDASNVQRLGAQGLQILLAASAAWRADGQPLTVANKSQAFEEGLRTLAAPEMSIVAGIGEHG